MPDPVMSSGKCLGPLALPFPFLLLLLRETGFLLAILCGKCVLLSPREMKKRIGDEIGWGSQ